ncbi:MAG: T9SS type A sorting domain-containing protein [Candidatus Hodarchaeota archaeon]
MKTTKKTIELVSVFVCFTFFFSNYLSAQPAVIIDTLAYTQISNLTDINPKTRIRISTDGSRVIFTGNYKQIFTMNSDGSQLNQVFDYETFRPGTPPFRDPFIDISGDGSIILWTDGANEIFTANFDGSNMKDIATLIPRDPPFADAEPDIRLAPRLTYDGSKVFFFNVAGGKDIAGLYTIGSDGSGLTKLFSYTDMSQNVFGMDGSEFNPNTAFSNYLDISDDGSKGVFATHNIDIATGHTIVFNNSTLRLLRNYGPLHANKPTGIGQFSISRDGNRVAIPFRDGSSWIEKIHVMDFSGDNQVELPYIFSTSGTFQLDSTGSNMLATYHQPEYGGSSPPPISIVDIDSSRILDLTLLEGNPEFVFRGARSPVFNYNAKTIFFINGVVREDSVEQIWELDINPDTLINHPTISDIFFSPNYALFDKSNSSTFRAVVHPASTNLLYVNWDTFKEGSYVFRGLRTFGISENLVDDGTLGDVNANDGIYTREEVYADLLEPPATLTVRIHADAGKYITSVDVAPFFVWDSVATSIGEDKKQNSPNRYELYANYPNPFNPSTKILYSILNSSLVTLKIYDIQGREIQTLVNEFQQANSYSVDFNASKLSSGIYFYSLQVGDDFLDTKKMLLMK